jgi:very-short-patch-repair endonuclease
VRWGADATATTNHHGNGGQHAANHVADVARTAELAGHGYRIIRFWNNEVMENMDGVLLVVLGVLDEAPTSP